MSWLRRLLNGLRVGRVHDDIDRELSFHLAERTDHLREQGLAPEEARRRARVQLATPSFSGSERSTSTSRVVWIP